MTAKHHSEQFGNKSCVNRHFPSKEKLFVWLHCIYKQYVTSKGPNIISPSKTDSDASTKDHQ